MSDFEETTVGSRFCPMCETYWPNDYPDYEQCPACKLVPRAQGTAPCELDRKTEHRGNVMESKVVDCEDVQSKVNHLLFERYLDTRETAAMERQSAEIADLPEADLGSRNISDPPKPTPGRAPDQPWPAGREWPQGL
jgi:hypothetical protein